jgi:ankyrin repeat protein
MRYQPILCLVSILAWPALAGCEEMSQLTGKTFHEKFGWKAEDYFTDPKVIALCHAIEANDLKEIDRKIAAGADVNAKGTDGMTPLLWAFQTTS